MVTKASATVYYILILFNDLGKRMATCDRRHTGESRYLEVHGTVAKFRVIRNSN